MSFDDFDDGIIGQIGSDELEEIVDARIDNPPMEEDDRHVTKDGEITDGILVKSIDDILHDSMIPYSEHVILERALPRVEDGLKPVQRRILYDMYAELHATPDKEFLKSARIVGDTMGKYHPHGDSSIYEAMVRMAQDFNMREMLVKGHGNFGSNDGDRAAAARYTEAKMSLISMELLRDINKDTVNWQLNYDDKQKEPITLPGRFPNLLVNGSSGIAVGLATNIPPHNLVEVIDGVIAYIEKPNITVDEIMKYIKGPDFPTGGYLAIGDELKAAYETGRGKVIMRAKITVEDDPQYSDRKNIVIHEMPYQSNKSAINISIASLKAGKYKGVLSGIAEIRDESDRTGMRDVIRLKKDANINEILEILYKYTNLQSTFGINMVAIANGKPMQLGLIEIIKYYVEYQRDVIVRKAKYELNEAKERNHILKGLIIAINNIDEVIKIVKKSPSTTEAKTRLRERFDLSDRQAQAILDMKISRLTSLEVDALEKEIKELDEKIERLTKILASKKLQFKMIKDDLNVIKKQFGNPRRTEIVNSLDDISVSDEPIEDVITEEYVAVSYASTLKRIPKKNYNLSSKEWSSTSTKYEANRYIDLLLNDKFILLFTDFGYCYRLNIIDIPLCKWKDNGVELRDMVKLTNPIEKVVATICPDEEYIGSLVFFTKLGMVKISDFLEYNLKKSSFQAIKLKDGDNLVNVQRDAKNTTLLFVSTDGMVLNAGKDEVSSTGRVSSGVKGINLNDNQTVVFAGLVSPQDKFILANENTFLKVNAISEFDLLSRYRKGLKGIFLDDSISKKVIFADIIKSQKQIIFENMTGNVVIDASKIKAEVRTAKPKPIKKSFKALIGYSYNI